MSGELEVTILGCGSSGGVPRLGGPDGAGDWGACDPANPKNRRRRCSILLRQKSESGETVVLVDTAPDMREQLLAAHCGRLDAVLITHDHADQTHGLDDLRAVAYQARERIDVYSDRKTLDSINTKFGYTFATPPNSGYPPILTAREIAPYRAFEIAGAGAPLPVLPFWQEHGRFGSLGFRFGPLAYSSDVNGLDDEAFAALEGINLWILDALRYAPHPTHANVETALAWIARVKPRHAILTNLHIDLDYETLKRELPAGVEPAFDGLKIALAI
ncbi:MAG TPA: MBL fold metallo-hydrolase [Rhizomicrobium sp.]|jgi:phosphoribosyl 1,2-cyclic phosphate phosphodiesterase|nr:MBL fold metallo-hydrolase [Rhizomicrobium sp.]